MKFTFQILVMALLVSACSTPVTQGSMFPTVTSTEVFQNTEIPQPTQTPTLFATGTAIGKKIVAITETHMAHLSAEATVAAFGTICEAPTYKYHVEISPDGNWIATMCRGQYGVADSYLQVVSIQHEKEWRIRHADYAKVVEYETDGMIHPFHWSADGENLYVTSPSRGSGCCWIGYNLLLVRLNLESGQQTEIANYIGNGIVGVDFSVSASDNYAIYIPQDGTNNLYILDLNTRRTRVINLKFENTGAGFTRMSNDDRKIILVLREYPEEYQGDLTFGSFVVIDLESAKQERIVTGMDYEDIPIPVEWKDDNHVLLQHYEEFFLLNIDTAALEQIENP